MKTRNGFVSNSSSSSFVCDVCGENQSGWDISLEEAGMFQCTEGHTFCEGHKCPSSEENVEKAYREKYERYCEYYKERGLEVPDYNAKYEDWVEDQKAEGRYQTPECNCPLCTMKVVDSGTTMKYLLKMNGWDKEDVEDAIKLKFNNSLSAFQKWADEKNDGW